MLAKIAQTYPFIFEKRSKPHDDKIWTAKHIIEYVGTICGFKFKFDIKN